jgi:2-hydroxy-3-oxopropionate reductase
MSPFVAAQTLKVFKTFRVLRIRAIMQQLAPSIVSFIRNVKYMSLTGNEKECVVSTKPTVGFIGLGLMGKHMARNLLKAGFPLVVYNRSRAAVDELVAEGAMAAGSPEAVARRAGLVVTMLPNSPDVQTVAAGEHGLFAGASAGHIFMDSSTISPAVTEDLARQAAAKGADWLDAPVSGGPSGAQAGTLSIMVGGSAGALERARPVLEAMGKTITHIGEKPGSGQIAKACNQVAAAACLEGVAEALMLARGAGADPQKVFQAIRGGAANSWQMESQGPRMLSRSHAPGFKAWMHLKDLHIALDTAARHNLPMPGTAQIVQLYASLLAAGHGEDNISALVLALENMAGIELTGD